MKKLKKRARFVYPERQSIQLYSDEDQDQFVDNVKYLYKMVYRFPQI